MPSLPQNTDNRNDIIDDLDLEPLSFDETVRRALAFCDTLPEEFARHRQLLAELQTRLSGGRLHFAVLGQFNRGKSTFINALLGIEALPSSVLPLTSVPTVIEYGTEQSCKIRFLDGKGDLVVKNTCEEIRETLRRYVAEENNPKNLHQVRDATITCASELLVNGTVLIDTPGFGSTHLHNTRTTLDLLVECDAALFLLSADPPMTQTEMEFLRDVKDRVPKIFFVLNKVDLLANPGLSEVDKFIRAILCRDLGFPADTPLFHTSAIRGEAAKKNSADDPDWAASGLEAVKKEALDFMIREKYFTLSDALRSKYGEAVAAIGALLEEKLNGRLSPINAMREETNAITNAIQSLSLELESELKKCAEEKDALKAKIEVWEKENREQYALSMNKALDVTLNGKYFPDEAAGIAATMLPKHSGSLGAQFLNAALEFANKSLRAIVIRHAQAFTLLQKRYAELAGARGEELEQSAEKLIERFEIGAPDGDAFDSAPWETPPPLFSDIFRKKSVRFEMIRSFYEPMCAKSVEANINTANKLATRLIDEAWEKTSAEIGASYRTLIDRLKRIYEKKERSLVNEEEMSKQEIGFLRSRIKELEKIVLVN